jgi:hypothetical protein
MVNQKYNLLIIIRLKPNKKKLKRNDRHLILIWWHECLYKNGVQWPHLSHWAHFTITRSIHLPKVWWRVFATYRAGFRLLIRFKQTTNFTVTWNIIRWWPWLLRMCYKYCSFLWIRFYFDNLLLNFRFWFLFPFCILPRGIFFVFLDFC